MTNRTKYQRLIYGQLFLFSRSMHRISVQIILFSVVCLLLFPPPAATQSKKPDKDAASAKLAIERLEAATEVLKKVATLPEGKGIPKDVAEKMNLIGVIPDAFQLSLLFARGVRGHGVASVRRADGWSFPSYFFFGRSTGFDMSSVGSKRFDLILAVVNADIDSSKKTDKTAQKNKDKKGKKDDKEGPQAYLFAFSEGALKPVALKTGVFSTLLGAQTNIVHDKGLNKAVYAVNGDAVLQGTVDNSKQMPPEIKTFRETVNALFPGRE